MHPKDYYLRQYREKQAIQKQINAGIRCGSCGHEVSIQQGDIVQLQDQRLGVVSFTGRSPFSGRFIDVVILSGKNRGVTTICDRVTLVVVRGYFHIDRKVC